MNFEVKYRAPNGALRVECIEAAGRAECIAQCRARGITPMRVAEGVAAGGRASPRAGGEASASQRRLRQAPNGGDGAPRGHVASILLVAVLLLLAAGGAWWWLSGQGSVPRPSAGGTPSEKARPRKGGSPSGKSGRASAKSFVATNKVVRTAAAEKPVIENADVFLEPRAKGRLVVISRPPGMIFTNSFENFVADVLTARPGERFLEVELGDWFDEEFKKALDDPIKVLPDDSEDVAATKEAVKEAKSVIRRHVEAGGSARELVLEARAELNKIADYRDKLQEDFKSMMLMENDLQTLRMYVREANDILKEYGAIPLDAPEDDEAMEELVRDYREFDETNKAHEKAEKAKKEKEGGQER